MSLRGSLDTFALPDVLALLATTAKSGELHVSGSSGGGRVWVERGQITGAEADNASSVVDVLVHLLRMEDGDFSFHADRTAPAPVTPVDVAVALEQADARLTEWREVEQLLPSPSARLTLAPAASGSVRLTRDQWAAVAAVGDGRPVEELVERLGGDELVRWRLLASLVEAGLVEVGMPTLVAPVRRTPLAEQLSTLSVEAIHDDDDTAGEDEDVVEAGFALETAEESDILDEADDTDPSEEPVDAPVPASAAAQDVNGPDGVSRGTLLKFLSSVRS